MMGVAACLSMLVYPGTILYALNDTDFSRGVKRTVGQELLMGQCILVDS